MNGNFVINPKKKGISIYDSRSLDMTRSDHYFNASLKKVFIKWKISEVYVLTKMVSKLTFFFLALVAVKPGAKL